MAINNQGLGLSRRKVLQAGGALATLAVAGASGAAAAAPDLDPDPDAVPLVGWSALELSAAIKSKQVSCVEVMQAYLAQIEARNPQVNALVSLVAPDALLAQAAQRDQELAAGTYHGWMHGMPHAVKDLADATGLLTCRGSPLFANNVATTDTIHVERIKRAGAIIIGKTNVPEFGLGSQSYNPVFGVTGNAFDHNRTAGGSSGGAAVGLAMQMLPVADGSDFMGSLRNPAAFNNVIGFRPSPGLVPLSNRYIEELPCNGPMGRTVSDTAMLLSTMAGHHPASPTSLPVDPATFTAPLARDWTGTRIGWLGDFEGYLPMQAGVLSLCEGALKGFTNIGCTVDAVQVDYSMPELWQTWLTFRHWLTRAGMLPLYADPKTRAQLKSEAVWEIEGGEGLTGEAVAQASAARGAWYQALRKLFQTYEFLVLPTAQVFPFAKSTHWPQQIGDVQMDTYHRWMEVVVPGTLSGCPVINVPAGFNAVGLPMGLQIIARRYADFAALQIGYGYEQSTPWNLQVNA